MRKLLAILFLFPLLCFGQSSKTPLNRAFLQTPLDGNGLGITNAIIGQQDVLVVASDSRWDVNGTPGIDSWLQLLQREPAWIGKYSLMDLARSSDSYLGALTRLSTAFSFVTNQISNQKRTALIMYYYNDSAQPLDTTKTNALIFWNYFRTNGYRVIVCTDPGPIATANLLNFNTWVTTIATNAYDVCWNLATNTPLTYQEGIHNDAAFNRILLTNFIANILPQTVSGLRPMLATAPSMYGPLNVYQNPNQAAPGFGVGINNHGKLRQFDGASVSWMARASAPYTNNDYAGINTDAIDTLQLFNFNTVRMQLDTPGYFYFNTNQNYGNTAPFSVSKPQFDAFSQTIADFYDQPGALAKVRLGTNGCIMMFKGANVSSASTITPSGAIFHVTGTVTINTINLPFTGFTGSIYIIPDGVFATGTSGNIQIASTAVVSKQLIMTYDGSKWYPNY